MHPQLLNSDEQWNDLMEALEFAERQFTSWFEEGAVRRDQLVAIQSRYQARREKWARAQSQGLPVIGDTGLRIGHKQESPTSCSFRYWSYVEAEVRRLAEEGLFTLPQHHRLRTECEEHLAALQRQLSHGEIPMAIAVEPQAAPPVLAAQPAPPPPPRRNLLEIVLDPRNIQWLLAFGGALMVVGLVILLWVNEFFTPPVVAVGLGAANGLLLVAGWWVLRSTRYQLAGRALTLFACLIMPLNLWYYHANHLITLDGHLWVAALVISVLYATSAVVLKDELFVYVFLAGVTLTGLLTLADLPPSPQRFWEIASPSTLLVVLGLLCIHTERVFPEQEGPFSRRRFGLAFFWSGHVLLAGGLLLVFGAQLAGDWLYEPVFKPFFAERHALPSPVVGELRWLALMLVAAGTYAYIYSDVVVRRIGVYVHVAAFTLMWAMLLLVEEFHLALSVDALMIVLSLTALIVNFFQAQWFQESRYTKALPIFGFLLPMVAVLLGVVVYLRGISPDLMSAWSDATPGWSYLGALVLTAISCGVGAHLLRKNTELMTAYLFAAAAATLTAAATLLAILGLEHWQDHGPLLMLVPIGYLVAARWYRGQPVERPLLWVSHAAAGVMLMSSLASAVEGFTVVEQRPLNLALALFFAEAAVFYGLAAALHRQALCVQASALLATATVWQLLTYLGVPGEYYNLAFALVGLGLLIVYRLALVERLGSRPMASATFQCANALLSLSFLGVVLLGLSRLAVDKLQWSFLGLCAGLTAISLLALAIVPHSAWRRWYLVTSIGQGILTFLAMMALSTLSVWQKLEIFSVSVGLLLLIVGHMGWYRERQRQNDLVSVSLLLGSLLVGIPLAIATLIDRGRDQFIVLNELGFLAAGVLLLTTGFVFQLRSTTLTGATLTVLYFMTLLIYVPWSRLNAVALFITIGGGTLFALGLILSVYRDRLLALPDRFRQRQGLFRVLSWR